MCDGPGGGFDPVLAAPFGLVERRIRRGEELRGRRRRRGGGHPEAGGDGDRRPVRRKDGRAGERSPNPLRQACRPIEIRARQDQYELLSAPPAGEVDVSDALLEENGERSE